MLYLLYPLWCKVATPAPEVLDGMEKVICRWSEKRRDIDTVTIDWFARVLHRILAWKSLTYWHFEGSGGAEFRFTKPMWVQRDPGPACWYELGSSFRSPRTSRFFTGCQRGWTYWGRGWWLGICWCLLWAHHWKFEGDKMMKLLKHDWNMINSDKTNELLACLDPFYTELSWYPGRCPVQSC